MPILTENTTRRLILSKQMYFHGTRHINDGGEIGRVVAIQALDYSVEMLLKTIVSHFGNPSTYEPPQNGYYNSISSLSGNKYNTRLNFDRLWDEVQGIFRDPTKGINVQLLPLRKEIDILHGMRNDIQHNGIIPSASEARKYANYAESFLREVCLVAFGQDIHLVTLSSLVKDDEIKIHVEEAENLLENNDYKGCIISATFAFEKMVSHDKRLKPSRRRVTSTGINDLTKALSKVNPEKAFEELMRAFTNDVRATSKARRASAHLSTGNAFTKLGEIVKSQQQEIQLLQEAIEVLVLGVDLRDYFRFRSTSPRILTFLGGNSDVVSDPSWNPDKEQASEVLSFVFETVLKWQETPIIKRFF